MVVDRFFQGTGRRMGAVRAPLNEVLERGGFERSRFGVPLRAPPGQFALVVGHVIDPLLLVTATQPRFQKYPSRL